MSRFARHQHSAVDGRRAEHTRLGAGDRSAVVQQRLIEASRLDEQAAVRQREVRAIQHVEEFGAELRADLLRDFRSNR